MNNPQAAGKIKKIVGNEKQSDVWDRLYRLNSFVAKLTASPSRDHGYPVRKTVGKPRAG